MESKYIQTAKGYQFYISLHNGIAFIICLDNYTSDVHIGYYKNINEIITWISTLE